MAAGSILNLFFIGGNCFVPSFHFIGNQTAESGDNKGVQPDKSSPVTSQCSFSSAKDDPSKQQVLSTSRPPNEDHQDVLRKPLNEDGSENCNIEGDRVQSLLQYPVARPGKQVQSSCSTLPSRALDTERIQACQSSGGRTQVAMPEPSKFDRKHGQSAKKNLISDPYTTSQGQLETQKSYLGEASDEVQEKDSNYFRDLSSYGMNPECKYEFIYFTEEKVREINLTGMKRISRGGNGTVFSVGIFAVKKVSMNCNNIMQ